MMVLSRFVQAIIDWTVRGLGAIEETLAGWIPSWLNPRFLWFFASHPFQVFGSLWELRTWRTLFLGLPALLALAGIFVLALQDAQLQPVLPDQYWDAASKALVKEDYSKAQLLLARVIQDKGARQNEAKFDLATLYEATGKTQQSELLFRSLAPDDRKGEARAHRRQAIYECELLQTDRSERRLNIARHHLSYSGDTSSIEMRLALGRFSLAQGDMLAARGHLEAAAMQFPEVWAVLGTVYLETGNVEIAQSSFEKARNYFSEKLEWSPTDRLTREGLADVLIRLGDLDQARSVLEAGLENDPAGRWHALLAQLYVNIHDLLAFDGGYTPGQLFAPLNMSLSHDPNYLPALRRLMSYMDVDPGKNEELQNILSTVVTEGTAPAMAHLALGNLACVEDDSGKAIFHFERAFQIDTSLTVVLNNMAWLTAHSAEPDYPQALRMVNAAIKEEPNNPRFLDTRGTIFLKLERWKEAMEDLELVIDKTSDPASVHGKLAIVYDHLNFPKIAESHRQQQIKKSKA